MSLISLAIVGKENEPLYLREFDTGDGGNPSEQDATGTNPGGEKDIGDPYGFFSADPGKDGESSLRHQVGGNRCMHF